MLLLKLWLQFCVSRTDSGYTGVWCSVPEWELVCHTGNPLPALLVSACCKLREQRDGESHSTGVNWCGCLCYRSLCSSCLVFCFFVFDRCTGHKYRSIACALGLLWQSLQWDVSVIGELLVSNRNSAPFLSLSSLI